MSATKGKGGRPQVGPPIHVRLTLDLLAFVDDQRAQANDGAGVSRAEMVRRLLSAARGTSGQATAPDVTGRSFRDQLYPSVGGRTCSTHSERPAVGRILTRQAGASDQRRYACGECWDGAEPWTSRRLDVTTSGGGS